MSLSELFSNLGGAEAHRAKQYVDSIMSNYNEFVEELCNLHQNLPNMIARLKIVRSEVDERHRTASCGVLAGSTVSAVGGIASLFALLLAPVTAGTSVAAVAATGTLLGAFTSIGAMGVDQWKQSSALKCSDSLVEKVNLSNEKAKKAFDEFKVTSELLRALISRNFPEFKRLDEDDMYHLSILIGNGMISEYPTACKGYLQSMFRGGIAVPHISTCVAVAGGVKRVSTVAILRSSTRLAFTNSARALGTEVAKSTAPVVAKKFSVAVLSTSKTAVEQGVNVLTKTTALNNVGAVVIRKGGKTFSLTKGLKVFAHSTVKDYGPLLAKVGTALSIVGIAFDIYSGLQAFTTIFYDKKCSASQAITKHIEEFEKLQLDIEKCLGHLQPMLESEF